MSNPLNLPLDGSDRLADPPLLDSLHYERGADGFSIIFVPTIGTDPKRSVFVARDSPDGRQISALLYRVEVLVGTRVAKVTHRGGGDYTLLLASGSTKTLSDEAGNETWAPEVFDRLKQIADVAEAAFQITHAASA